MAAFLGQWLGLGLCALGLTLGLTLGQALPALAQPATAPQQVLQQLFQDPAAVDFTPTFLRQIPLGQMQAILADIAAELGELEAVVATAEGFELRFSRGRLMAQLQLDAAGRIAGLRFQPAAAPLGVEDAVATLRRSPHTASLLVQRDGETLGALQADRPLAVGSTFKLAVLAALQQQIAAGDLSWDTVVPLQSAWQSLPSGILQDWPSGTPLTLQTLATLMISISDNTATDALIHLVGRRAVAAYTQHSHPLLTTREAFVLKNPNHREWLERYRQASPSQRLELLPSLAALALPDKSLFASDPMAIDVEWFFTPAELCQLLEQTAALPLWQVNPGPASSQRWQHIAFKGGSEPGVLNLTTRLQGPRHTYCVSATWNDAEQALDEAALTQLYRQILLGLEP